MFTLLYQRKYHDWNLLKTTLCVVVVIIKLKGFNHFLKIHNTLIFLFLPIKDIPERPNVKYFL